MPESTRRSGGAVAVAAGIFLSRIAGLVRERVITHYLGLSDASAAFRRALQIPNLLQVLLGEGVLSASFIPVYSRLMAEGKPEEAARVARVVGTLVALVASVVAILGVLFAGPIVELIAPGFKAESRALTAEMVRIMFPGMALLAMSAWCLGVLNSHRRFFLSYASPVLWNAAMIAVAIVAARSLAGDVDDIAWWLAWGALIGSAAQLLVQLPLVIRLLRGLSPSLDVREPGVRATLRAFVPVVLGRGSVQLSSYIDQAVASFLGERVVSAMALAQTLYLLPVSLFGMAVSASELPEMSSGLGDEAARHQHVRDRLAGSLRRVVFFVIPSAIAFGAIGGSIVALLFQTGAFTVEDSELVWLILAGAAIGLLPNTIGRLFGSAFYALGEPKPPLRASLVRIVLSTTIGFIVANPLRVQLGYSRELGAFGVMVVTGLAGWIELALLYRWLAARIGKPAIPWKLIAIALVASLVAGGLGYGAGHLASTFAPYWLAALVAIGVFGGVYFVAMALANQPEANAILRRLRLRR